MERLSVIEQSARRIAALYGYQEVRIPMFEVTELFARSIGATTDIVEKEMYTFRDRDNTSLTLRPEGTAGAVRAYIEHNLPKNSPLQKWFYLGPMFRHERPQAGRLRQFNQLGLEYFGTSNPAADAEVMSLLWNFLHDLDLPSLALEVNSLGDSSDRESYKPLLLAFLHPRSEEFCENCRKRLDSNVLRVFDCKMPTCRELTKEAPRLIDHISPKAKGHFEEVLSRLTELAIPYTLNPRLIRGLDYYALTTFEVTSKALGAQNAVCGGGRYDGLVEVLGGLATPAVGFAVGLERVSLLLSEQKVPHHSVFVYVAGFGKNGVSQGWNLLHHLRSLGIPADAHFDSTTLKAHLRQADRKGATYSLIVGDDEVAKAMVLLRNMKTSQQEEVSMTSLSSYLQSLFSFQPS